MTFDVNIFYNLCTNYNRILFSLDIENKFYGNIIKFIRYNRIVNFAFITKKLFNRQDLQMSNLLRPFDVPVFCSTFSQSTLPFALKHQS